MPKWSLAVAIVSLLIMLQCGFRLMQGRKQSDAAVAHFHRELNASQYDEIIREADAGLTEGKTKEDSVKFLQAAGGPLKPGFGLSGEVGQRNLSSCRGD